MYYRFSYAKTLLGVLLVDSHYCYRYQKVCEYTWLAQRKFRNQPSVGGFSIRVTTLILKFTLTLFNSMNFYSVFREENFKHNLNIILL
jgi:hypothetical protein